MIRHFGPMSMVTLLLMPALAFAIPAPMSPAELMANSDIVVDAEVSVVSCLGAPVTTAQKTITSYRATLTTIKTYKGTAPGQFHIEFTIEKWTGMQPIGGWKEPTHLVGEAGKYHLKLKKSPDTYGLTWWNAQSKTSNGQAGSLSDCTGGSSGADAGSSGADAGSSNQDAGSATVDAGPTPAPDSGSSAGSDAAAPVDTAAANDAGGAKDTGSASVDAGGSVVDAGTPVDAITPADTTPSKPAPAAKKSSGCQTAGQPWGSPLAAMAMLAMALCVLIRRRRA